MLTGYIVELNMSFGENLKRLRRDKGWTQAQLAKAAGLKMTHIPKLEHETADPKLSSIYKLINALGCSSDTLLMDPKKTGIDTVVKASLDRVMQLPEGNKRVLIDVIDKYCIATGLQQAFSEENKVWPNIRIWDEAPKDALPPEDKNEQET